MNKNFDKNNTVKYTHKGPLGRNNRRNASRYYENTMELFDVKDYGKGFEAQKSGLSNSLFALFRGDGLKTAQLVKFANAEKGANTNISVKEALALRQNGWTLDRLLMRSRDKQYIFAHSKKEAKHWGKRYEVANAEPSLTLQDALNFLTADRLVNEPSMTAKFKTAQELQDMGYVLGKNAQPVITMDDVAYYDITACKMQDSNARFDIYPGFSIDDIKLATLENGEFTQAMIAFGNALNMNIVDDYGKIISAEITRRHGALGGLGHKLRASIRRANTGVRDATTTRPFVGYNGNNTTPSVVMDAIEKVATVVADETFAEYRDSVIFDSVYKKNAQFINDATSSLIASAIVRMGMFSDKDASILSKVYRTNAARILADAPDTAMANSAEIMDAITQLYSISMRRVANATDLDFATFARQSGMEYDENDLIFDQILCRPAKVKSELYNSDLITAGESIIADMLAKKAAEEAEKDKDEAEKKAEEEAEKETKEETEKPETEEEASEQPARDEKPETEEEALKKLAEELNRYAKWETFYMVKDDFGFVPTNIDEKNKIFRKAIHQKRIMRMVGDELIKPVMSEIMKEYSQDYNDNRQDDICSVIRKYNEWMDIAQMSGTEKKEQIKAVVAKIDNVKGDAMRTSVISIEKALNLYKLTYDITSEVIEYKKCTESLADCNSPRVVLEGFIKEYDGKETMRAELTELVKSEILGLAPSYEQEQPKELKR